MPKLKVEIVLNDNEKAQLYHALETAGLKQLRAMFGCAVHVAESETAVLDGEDGDYFYRKGNRSDGAYCCDPYQPCSNYGHLPGAEKTASHRRDVRTNWGR